MSKLISGLILGVLLLVSSRTLAQPVVTITPQSVEVGVNQEFTVDVVVSKFSNIASFQFPIVWNSAILEYVSVSNINGTALPGFNENSVGFNAAQPGKLTILWFEQNFSGLTLPDNTRLFTIRFKGKANGTTQVAITNDAPGIEVTDPNENEVGLTPKNATVKVGDGGSVAPTFKMAMSDHSNIEIGQQVCVQVTVEEFTTLIGLQFSISYDAARLTFKQARNLNTSVTGLTAAAVTNPSAGVLSFQWTDASNNGVTLAKGAVLMELCFDAKAAGTATATFGATPLAIEVTQKTGAGTSQKLQFTTDNSTISITEPTTVVGFQLQLSDVTVQPGEDFCLPVKVYNFQDIVGLQFTIRYDPNLLQFVQVKNFNATLTGLDVNNITNPSAGVLRFQWNDAGFTGIDLGNGAIVLELCFKARSAGTTKVEFSSTPLAIEVTQKVPPDDQKLLEFKTVNSNVTIKGNSTGPGFAGFGLYMEDATVQSGARICIPVKVQDFKNILGMQFSIKYDAAALQFVEAKSFGLDGLTAGSIGAPSAGVLTLVWDDPAVVGKTLANGAAIMELCFTAKGANGTTTTVSFENTPTKIEFVQLENGQEKIVTASFRNAQVTIGSGDGSFQGFGLIIADGRVESGKDICVPVTAQDFNNILGMQFSITYNAAHLKFNSAKSFGLDGLSTGSFGNPTPGVLTLVWDDPAVAGKTLANGATLFELCFTALAANGTVTNVALANSPTPIEFVQKTNTGEQTITANSKPGKITIDKPAVPTIVNPATITNVNCFGQSTGAINIEMQGGSGSFTYKWSFENRATQDLNNIPAGTYNVTVTDTGNNQTVTGSFTVTQPAAALSATSQATDADCAGQGGAPNGSITVTPAGGTSPYTFDWSGNLPDGVGRTAQTGLAAGTYSFTITDARGCTFNSAAIQVKQKATAQLTLTPTSINTGSDGAVGLTVTGGTAPLTFSWSGPQGFTSAQQNLSGLSRSGEYCVTVTDANNCKTEQCVTVYQVLKFARVDIVNACSGEKNGSITITMSGGLAPYTYQWGGAAGTGASLTNLAAGNYSLTVTDSKGDKLNGTFEITELSAITVDGTVTAVTGQAGNTNGAVKLTISGGRPGYSIRWSTGATGTQLTNLATGNYCVTVTDQNNCSEVKCFDVKFQAVPLSFTAVAKSTSCNGGADGGVTINIQGGSQPYEVVFADGRRVTATNGQVTRADLKAGTVNFTVQDGGGTNLQGTATVPQPEAIRISEMTVVHDTDAPGCSGSIKLTFSGGTSPYTVSWNSPNTGAQIINLCAGPFIPTVADSKNCTATFDPIQITTFTVSGEVTNATCSSADNGGIKLTISGGATPYTYQWVDADGKSVSTAANLQKVKPGRYRVTVSEKSGNSLVREFAVGSTSNLSVTASVLSNYNGYGVSCPDATDGRLQAQAQSGTGKYSYEWTRGETMVGTDAVLVNARAGKYEVTAIDESGCESTAEVELLPPPGVAVTASVIAVSCNGNSDGEIDVRASGGVTNNVYTYQWSNNSTGPRISRLRSGSYVVTVTDRNNCKTTGAFEIKEPQPLKVTVETKAADDGCNGRARAVVTGGTAPFVYRWNSSQTDSLITGLCPGTYIVDVIDSRGCKPQQNNAASGKVEDRRFPCMQSNLVLTPNDDGDNELFFINCIGDFPNNHLEIYNRWGQLVYEKENYDNTWNARTSDGSALPEGAYYYVLQYIDSEGVNQQLKGSITVLRD